VAVLVVAGIVLLLALRSHRGRRKDWRSRAMAAYARASSLHDAVSAEFPAVAPGADARWAELASLTDSVTADLHGLEAGAPDQAARIAVTSAITALSALRSAIQTSRAAPSVQTLDTVRTTLSTFELSLGALKNAAGVRA
jgi:hypothetical protein